MATLTATDPLVEELMKTEGKAEIVGGKVVELPLAGAWPSHAAGQILFSLMQHEEVARGEVYSSTVGFLCDLPHRGSFSPDASFYNGPHPADPMKFLPQAPIFAVEVRNLEDYGRLAEAAIADKIEDYFAAGTQVVWDVDLLHEPTIAKFSAPDANNPQFFRRGEIADAGEAVAGWTFEVDALFPRLGAR